MWRRSLYVRILRDLLFVIAAPYLRSIVMFLHIVKLLMRIRNVQWTMSSLYPLRFFLTYIIQHLAK